MKLEESKHSIAELVDLYNRGDMTVNEEYQRQPRLWPPAARSYFIDTILSGFPFPKIYLMERLNMATLRPAREIVDGQQRMMSILDYRNGKFALGKNSMHFEGLKFSQLSEDKQIEFLTYSVSVEVIRDATRPDILQMFRRMNAYTLPLNDAEKRHSEFFGVFKDWVNKLLDNWGVLIAEWKILTSRSIVRMEDAELIAEVVLALRAGVVSSSPAQLRKLYDEFDKEFPDADDWSARVNETFAFIQSQLSPIQTSFLTKPYAFLSLITALLHNRWGIPNLQDQSGIVTTGQFTTDVPNSLEKLLALASAHETKDMNGEFKGYVEACKGGGNRVKQRLTRVTYLCKALQGTI